MWRRKNCRKNRLLTDCCASTVPTMTYIHVKYFNPLGRFHGWSASSWKMKIETLWSDKWEKEDQSAEHWDSDWSLEGSFYYFQMADFRVHAPEREFVLSWLVHSCESLSSSCVAPQICHAIKWDKCLLWKERGIQDRRRIFSDGYFFLWLLFVTLCLLLTVSEAHSKFY